MGVEKIEAGMLAISRAGHDKDTCYIVWDMDETYVWLVDGRLRPLEKPKKKKRKKPWLSLMSNGMITQNY